MQIQVNNLQNKTALIQPEFNVIQKNNFKCFRTLNLSKHL
jgi:hypothetical protein